MAPEKPITVAIVDDHPMLLDGSRSDLDRAPDIEVKWVAHDGQSALSSVRACQPRVLVLDLRLPDISGVDVARQVQRTFPGIAILALTGYDDPAYLRELLAMGIRGYVSKSSSGDQLADAVRALAAGRTCIVANSLSVERADRLTEREVEVLTLVADGLTNAQIARQLCLSEKTIELRMTKIFRKLDARSRAQAILKAQQQGVSLTSST